MAGVPTRPAGDIMIRIVGVLPAGWGPGVVGLWAALAGMVRRRRTALAAASAALLIAACGGGGGGGDDDVAAPPPPPGGSGTGADGVPVFWNVYDMNVAVGFGFAVQQSADGGIVVAGAQASDFSVPYDFLVMKTDERGVRQWSRRVAWSGGGVAHAVRSAADGSVMAAGVGGAAADAAAVMIRLDASGNLSSGWPKTYGPSGARSGLRALHAINGGADGYLAAGFADAGPNQGGVNVFVLRIDAAGAVLWQRFDYAEFCGAGGDEAYAITPTADGHYVLAGRTGCLGWAGFLLKVNGSSGAEIWRRSFDGDNESAYLELDSVVATADGGLFATGQVGTDCGPLVGGTCDALLIKTDGAGNELWRRTYGGAEKDGGVALARAADGSALVAGYSRSYGGAIQDPTQAFQWADTMLMKIAADGATSWHKIKGLRPRGADLAQGLATTADGGFVITGSSGGNVMIAKFDKNGDTVNLGASYDLTINLPPVQGLIGFGNAVETATLGANALLLPRQVGAGLLDRLVDASLGVAPSVFCTGGGGYSFAPAVPATLSPGTSFTLTISNCNAGGTLLAGSATLSVDSASGSPASGNYGLQVTLSNLSLSVDEQGTAPPLVQTFGGGLRIARDASGGAADETLSAPIGITLLAAESSGATVLRSAAFGPMSVRVAVSAGGAVSFGQPGDTVSATSGGTPYTVGVQQAIDMPATGDPTAGRYTVGAPDGSRLAATISSGSGGSTAALAVDTTADGVDDGTVSVPWEFVY